MNEAATFGVWLRQRRKALDLTQEQLADRVGCSDQTIRKIEAGRRRPSREMVDAIAQRLAVPPEERPFLVEFARVGPGALLPGALLSQSKEPEILVASTRPNLPSPLTTFVGRQKETEAVRTLLRREDVLLLTLTGAGGSGKTRLAVRVISDIQRDFPDGAFFVALAPITDPSLVIPTIARTLGLRESPDTAPIDSIKSYLSDKCLLLLLDNFEQVIAAGPLVAEMLSGAPNVKVLVTSREPLHLYGEHCFAVPPLRLLEGVYRQSLEDLGDCEAVQLFVQRASLVKHDFVLREDNAAAVLGICERLDGLPLAIELAAARMNMFTPQAILARMENTLSFLTGGPRDLPARQQTLRGAIDWSYNLLSQEEQTLFARLAVFAGGCTFGTIQSVCNFDDSLGADVLDVIASLVDKSLLRQVEGPGAEPRFAMLTLIREYAQERLAKSSEMDTMRRHHAIFCLALAEEAEPHLTSGERRPWLDSLDTEQPNFRAALEWCRTRVANQGMGLRLAAALGWYWYFRSQLGEGYDWLQVVLATAPPSGDNRYEAKALNSMARLAMRMTRLVEAQPWLEKSIRLSRESGDKRELAFALSLLGLLNVRDGLHSAISLNEESVSLFREVGDKWGEAYALDCMADATDWLHDTERVAELYQESLALYREVADDWGIASELRELASMDEAAGESERAVRRYRETLAIDSRNGDRWNMAYSYYGLAIALHDLGNLAGADSMYREAHKLFHELGIRRGEAGALRFMGHLAQAAGDLAGAQELFVKSMQLARGLDSPFSAILCLAAIGGLLAKKGLIEEATVLFGAVEAAGGRASMHNMTVDRANYETHLVQARTQLSEDAFAAAWQRGSCLALADAISFALGRLALLETGNRGQLSESGLVGP